MHKILSSQQQAINEGVQRALSQRMPNAGQQPESSDAAKRSDPTMDQDKLKLEMQMLGMKEVQRNAIAGPMKASEWGSHHGCCTTSDTVRDALDAVGHNSDGAKEVRLRRFISL